MGSLLSGLLSGFQGGLSWFETCDPKKPFTNVHKSLTAHYFLHTPNAAHGVVQVKAVKHVQVKVVAGLGVTQHFRKRNWPLVS